MRLAIQALGIVIFVTSAFATQMGGTLHSFKIENQFDESVELTADTQWVLFSNDMKPAKVLTEYLNKNSGHTDLSKTLIVSDISRMPSLVSKMFAIPKMKKYSFKMALDKTGETTKSWPRKEGSLTAMKLSNFKVEAIEYLSTPEDVATFFTSNALKVTE